MNATGFVTAHVGEAVPRATLKSLAFDAFRRTIIESIDAGRHVAALFGDALPQSPKVDLYAVLTDSAQSLIHLGRTTLDSDRFPSITPDCPQVHLFEREIAEQYGVRPEGHPWFKPVRFHSSYRPGHDAWGRKPGDLPIVGDTDFYRVEGAEIHEVAVGPVHAGIIEPGHFRFQCHGENVFHLEISLGYQHRGAERTLVGGPNQRTIHTVETVAGDTSIGHATAYCQAVESLAGMEVPMRAEMLRGIALELERLANHTGDLGALAGDVGFLPTLSYCGRIRGDFLNLMALLCGSRFGRGMIRPGGVVFDMDATRKKQFARRLESAYGDVENAVNLLFNSASVQARFEETGAISPENCRNLGLVGPAARACGIERDVRRDFPTGIFRFAQVPVSTWPTRDVFALAYVRWLEIQRSVAFIREQLAAMTDETEMVSRGESENGRAVTADSLSPSPLLPFSLSPDHLVVTLVEGWRGEICHVALTDGCGRFSRYKIVDPSFHNWSGLAMALRDQQISDFPLCNKSFNLSYCGFDL